LKKNHNAKEFRTSFFQLSVGHSGSHTRGDVCGKVKALGCRLYWNKGLCLPCTGLIPVKHMAEGLTEHKDLN
jgi:hypothetical protein